MTNSGIELVEIVSGCSRGLEETGFDFGLTYYLAGPMTGYPDYNQPQFALDSSILRDAGIALKSPHEAKLPPEHLKMSAYTLWTSMMRKTSMMMMLCDGIILIKGWPQSKGARVELQFALDHDWPVYYYNDYILTSMNRKVE